MRRSSRRLGQVLEPYEQEAIPRERRAGAPMASPRLVSRIHEPLTDPETAAHDTYRRGVAEQAEQYLDGLRGGERVMMHFEYHSLSPIDGGPRDIDVLDALRKRCKDEGIAFAAEQVHDIGVHLTVADGWT
jgi:hypothetical protein